MAQLSGNTYRTFAQTYRHEQLEGRDYIVAPVVAIVSGVLNGEFVPSAEIANGFASWNGRPVTLDHPNIDGAFVTANAPEIWEQFVIGKLFNVKFSNDRLKGEIWVDVQLAGGLEDGQLLLNMLSVGDPIEVSTAYFRELDPVAGEWNGIPYKGIAQDLKPDHLAILLRTAGACSWADGCGVPRLNQREVRADMPYANEHAARLKDPAQFDEFKRDNDKFGEGIDAIWGIMTNGESHAELQAIRFDKSKYTPAEAKAWLEEHDYDPIAFEPAANEAEPETNQEQDEKPVQETWWERLKGIMRAKVAAVAANEESLEEQWDAVVSAFYRLIESGQPVGDIGDGYVAKVFADHIIVERVDGTLFSVDYTTGDAGIEFGNQVQVEMVYRPVSNETAPDSQNDPEEEMPAEEPAINEEPADESEEPAANESEQDEEPENEMEPEPATNEMADQDADDEAEDEPPEEPAINESPCQQYVDLVEFADSHGGPDWALSTLQATVKAAAEARANLIETLVANEACAFSVTDLEGLGNDALEKLRLTLEAPRANYAGQPKTAKPEQKEPERRRIKLPPLGS